MGRRRRAARNARPARGAGDHTDDRPGGSLASGPTRHRPFAVLASRGFGVRPPGSHDGPPSIATSAASRGSPGTGGGSAPAAPALDDEFELIDDGASLFGLRPGLDRRLLRELRAERWPARARLDLHGMLADEAEEELARFLAGRRTAGDKVVLVICGRGVHSTSGVGVLRAHIGRWLTRGPASEHVLCFTAARPERGGDGAVYVMLRSAASRG